MIRNPKVYKNMYSEIETTAFDMLRLQIRSTITTISDSYVYHNPNETKIANSSTNI